MIGEPIFDGPSYQTNAISKKLLKDVFSTKLTGGSGLVIKVVGLLTTDGYESPYKL